MIYKNYEEFTDRVRETVLEDCSTYFVIMRSGYSVSDLLESTFTVETVSPYFPHTGENGIMWFNDWYEGQQYIELYDMIPEEKLLDILFHTRSTEDITD